SVGKFPRGIVFDKANIWVTDYGDNKVTKLRASDGTVVGAYNVGRDPAEITFDGSNIWVINYGSGNLMKIKPADGSTIGTFTSAGHANPQPSSSKNIKNPGKLKARRGFRFWGRAEADRDTRRT